MPTRPTATKVTKGLTLTPATGKPLSGSPSATRKRISAVRTGSMRPRPVKRGY